MTLERGRRAVFLQELGVGAVWVRRAAETIADSGPAAEASGVIDVADVTGLADVASAAARPDPVPPPPAAASAEGAGAAWDDAPLATDPATLPSGPEIALMDWPQLQAAVSACCGCDLCRTRNQTVFGSGDRQAKWLFVGEGPGRTEDQQGAPFVGPAGKLLDRMLAAIGLQRDANVYLANVVKCRPADENGPDHALTPQQIALCKPYLERQIALLQPTLIVALGKTAALALLGCAPDTSLASLRGRSHRVNQTPIVITYHPAYLLRNPIAKREAWDDLCLALRTYDQSIDQAAE